MRLSAEWAVCRALALTLFAGGCASLRAPREDVPPLTLVVDVASDSATGLLAAALQSAGIPLDNGGKPFAGSMTSTYRVRQGGLGQAEVELRFRVEPDGSRGQQPAASRIEVHGVLRETPRRFGVGDAREAQNRRDPQPIRAEDAEAMGPIRRMLRYLREAGARGQSPS
jgi:hypothetical protein